MNPFKFMLCLFVPIAITIPPTAYLGVIVLTGALASNLFAVIVYFSFALFVLMMTFASIIWLLERLDSPGNLD